MAKWWLKLAVGIWFLMFSSQVITASRLEGTVGQVHWLVDNQRVYNRSGFEGDIGRAVANKWVVASEQVIRKVTETVDPNIIFFIGHPNERVGVKEQSYLPWWLLPFWVVGLVFMTRMELVGLILASAVAMGLGTSGIGMYPMVMVYGWLIIKGAGHIWQRK